LRINCAVLGEKYLQKVCTHIKMESPKPALVEGGDRTFFIKKDFKVVETFNNVRWKV